MSISEQKKLLHQANKEVNLNNFEEQIIQRISECQLVADKLNNDPAWKIIIKDLDNTLKDIDCRWQNITDETILQKARTMKVAVMHLMDTKKNYEDELKAAQDELKKIQNPAEIVQKDYDLEGVRDGE